jgi:hypothetical protein
MAGAAGSVVCPVTQIPQVNNREQMVIAILSEVMEGRLDYYYLPSPSRVPGFRHLN